MRALGSIGFLAIVIIMTFLGTYESAFHFIKGAKYRSFWLKVWLSMSVIVGLLLWAVLVHTGK